MVDTPTRQRWRPSASSWAPASRGRASASARRRGPSTAESVAPTARGALVLAGSPGERRRPTPPHGPGRTVHRPRQPPLQLNRMKGPPAGLASQPQRLCHHRGLRCGAVVWSRRRHRACGTLRRGTRRLVQDTRSVRASCALPAFDAAISAALSSHCSRVANVTKVG